MEVSFRNKQLQVDSAVDVKQVVDALLAHKDAKVVDLGGNTFSLEACEAISQALAQMPALTTLKFDDMFTRRKVDSIHPSLRLFSFAVVQHPLVYLDLSDNALNPVGAEAIGPLLANCLTITTLKLNNTGVGPSGGEKIGHALLDAYHKGQAQGTPYRLRHFILGRSRLENLGIVSIAAALKAIGTLVELRVNNNGIHDEGIQALADIIGGNPELEIIEISDNRIKAAGAPCIAQALRKCPHLHTLIMESVLLRDAGGLHVTAALKHLPKLRELDLCYNELTLKTGEPLSKTLKHHHHLQHVRVNGNEFGSVANTLFDFLQDKLGTLSDNESTGDEQSDAEGVDWNELQGEGEEEGEWEEEVEGVGRRG